MTSQSGEGLSRAPPSFACVGLHCEIGLFGDEVGIDVRTGESSGGWVKVTRADGSTGWVYSSFLASNASAAPPPTRVASAQPRAVIHGGTGDLADRTARIASRLPAYARPNDGAQSVFMLQPGDQVYIAEVRGSWLRVETEDGMTAWIRR